MKATFTTIIISFFLLFSNSSFGQDYLIVFTRPKGNGGCGDMRYQKIEMKNKDDYWKQSEALQKQYAKEAYKDHYVSAQEYAVVMESTGQYTNISCKFKKY